MGSSTRFQSMQPRSRLVGYGRDAFVPKWIRALQARRHNAIYGTHDFEDRPTQISHYDPDLDFLIQQWEPMAESHGVEWLEARLVDRLSAVIRTSAGRPLNQPLAPSQDGGKVYNDLAYIRAELAGELPVELDEVPVKGDYTVTLKSANPGSVDWHQQSRPEGMLNLTEAAQYVGCSTATISERVRSGQLPFIKTKGSARWFRKEDLDHVRVTKYTHHDGTHNWGVDDELPNPTRIEEVMNPDDDASIEDLEQRPITCIPIGTDWQSFRGFHPGALVRVERESNVNIRYRSLRLGKGEGTIARGKRHRLTRQQFLERYRPYRRKDWLAATLEVPESQTPAQPAAKESQPTMTWTYAITNETEAEPVMEAVPPTNTTPEPSLEATGHRRSWQEVKDTKEINDIVELWRSDIPVDEIATAYRLARQGVYRLVAQHVGQEEYGLRSVMEFLHRNPGQRFRPSRLSQMTVAKDSQFLERVLKLGEQKGMLKVWADGKYRLVGLPDAAPAPVQAPIPEEPVVVPAAVAEAIPVTLDTPDEGVESSIARAGAATGLTREEIVAEQTEREPVTPSVATVEPMGTEGQDRKSYTVEPSAHKQQFRVTIRRVVEDHYLLEADHMVQAAQIASDGLQPNEEVWNISVAQ